MTTPYYDDPIKFQYIMITPPSRNIDPNFNNISNNKENEVETILGLNFLHKHLTPPLSTNINRFNGKPTIKLLLTYIIVDNIFLIQLAISFKYLLLTLPCAFIQFYGFCKKNLSKLLNKAISTWYHVII